MAKAMTTKEVIALPASVDIPTAGLAVGGIGRTTAHALARRGEFPVPVHRIGNAYRVNRADILRFLGIDDPTLAAHREPAEMAS
ncbi:helix-turn-helix domain-containing protein [Nonomuraea sp. NPDC049480]|uniref:helix-turn-helix domain-containing protein n=1 Tax=Nonomuraea sp. NPDC049480 TaxID=3364353 RepID=UPI0037A8F89E